MLGTVWEPSTKKDCVLLLSFVLCEGVPKISKQLEKVPSFLWPCQPQRERIIELEGLSSKCHTFSTRRKMTPTFSDTLCMIFLGRWMKSEHKTLRKWSLY